MSAESLRVEPLLDVRRWSIRCGDRFLLREVSFQVLPCTVTSIVGPSGVGKTTLLRSLNRLYEEEVSFTGEGSILFQGQDIGAPHVDKYQLRRQIGMLFQRPIIFPISIFKNVVFGVHHLKLAHKRDYPVIVERFLKAVYLWDEVKDRLKDSALALSIGQQQRLALARTLAVQPEVLLMDEPTSALDARATEKIEQLILELKRRHAIVLVTHQIDQANRLSDRTLFLEWSNGSGQVADYNIPQPLEN